MAILTPEMSGMTGLGMLARQRRRRASQIPGMNQGQTLAQAQMQGGMQSAVRSAAANPTSQGLSSTQPPATGAVQQTQSLMQTQPQMQQAGVEPPPTNTLRRKRRAPGLSAQAIT